MPPVEDGYESPPASPILKFSSPAEFRARHELATTQEFEIQVKKIDTFNSAQAEFAAWVIMAPSFEYPWRGYIVRVDLNQDLQIAPGIGQSCRLRFINRKRKFSSWCFCRRGPEIISMNESWSRSIELVDVLESDLAGFEECLVPLFDRSTASRALYQDSGKAVGVQLELEVSETTMLAELGALNRLTNGEAGKGGTDAFRFMMNFEKPTKSVDLCESFPHLADLDDMPDARLGEKLKKVVADFDEDQTRAMLGISSLPEGLCFAPGGPGAGKTWWALMMAILAQSGWGNCPTLYLIDINKPADDAADRMYSMCRQLGTEKSVIRVAGWRMVSTSSDDQEREDDTLPGPLRNANFSEGFLRAREPFWAINVATAPTLDEKAWEQCSAEPESHPDITGALDSVLGSQRSVDWETNMELLRKSLVPLYYDVLRFADFIATTPATAPRIAEVFKPELIIFDECAHARELSTMISLAYFEPKAWFFVGDHRQTEPFVAARKAKFSLQLQVSTIERADRNGATTNQLLVNHRAFGGLERLPSNLFYEGAMRSGKTQGELSAHGANNQPSWLKSLAKDEKLVVPRLLVVSHGKGTVARVGTSCWNPGHQKTTLEHVSSLLEDPSFMHPDGATPGTIMILAHYKEAVNRYQGAINRLFSKQSKRRVQVRTVDTAQGQEADVVVLDLVNDHQTVHIANQKRLCVALTRARQAEVILVHGNVLQGDLRKLYDQCFSGDEGTVLDVNNKLSSPPSPAWERE